jgi:CheY-like chemotaxis protein
MQSDGEICGVARTDPVMSDLETIRVLLVEDEFLISELVRDSLEEQGFAVYTAANACDALRLLVSSHFDVLFTDINLPGGMDGTTLAQRARELCPGLAVVYASGAINALAADRRVPGSLFVPKPYVPEAIGRLLADAVTGTDARAFA